MSTETFPALVIDDRALLERRYDGPVPKPRQNTASVHDRTASSIVVQAAANGSLPASKIDVSSFP